MQLNYLRNIVSLSLYWTVFQFIYSRLLFKMSLVIVCGYDMYVGLCLFVVWTC